MIKGSGVQKQRLNEILWTLWFDEKICLNYLLSFQQQQGQVFLMALIYQESSLFSILSYLWQYHCFPFLWAAVLYKYVCIYAVDLLINVYQNRLQKYYIKCIYQSTYLVASILSSHLHTLLPIIRYIKRSDSKLSLLIGLKS